MICKDTGIPLKDDYTNIEAVEELGIINENLMEKPVEANGLRNRLVHHYNRLFNTKKQPKYKKNSQPTYSQTKNSHNIGFRRPH